jgi:hypothetical protein
MGKNNLSGGLVCGKGKMKAAWAAMIRHINIDVD